MNAELVAELEVPLPASLSADSATAVFLYGTCFHRHEAVADLEIAVGGGLRHRPTAAGMPRPDVYRREGAGYRSAFWAIVPVAAGDRPVELSVTARLASGARVSAPLGTIGVAVSAPPRVPARREDGLIAVCMATHEPDPALFRNQVDSLRAQTDDRWLCVISDDGSGPEGTATIAEAIGDDPRFEVSRPGERLGFYRNFERALRLAPSEAELIALSDQDDRWWPEKLATLRAALGDAQMVYSDMRLVDAEGRVLRDTLWRGRRNNHTDLVSLLVANSITGAATLFRREVAERALPFPDTPGLEFHDHWIGLVALATGDVAYVDRPLYDYTQHPKAFFGAVTHGGAETAGESRWRGAYFRGYLPRVVQARVLLARGAGRLPRRKRRLLSRFVAAERSPLAFAWLAVRPLRVLAGRTETLGSEGELARGIAWRWAIAALAARAQRPGRWPLDASLPGVLSFQQRRLRRWRARV